MIVRALYTLAWWCLLPLAFVYLWRRGRRQPAYRHDWAERLGRYPAAPAGPLIWLHAVSVGETRAAVPLVQALRARHPDHAILLTQMTPTGRDTARQLFGDSVTVAYLPYDLPFAVGRFLRHYRPRFGVLMEMEIWPNLLHRAADAGVPLYLVNARLSEKSLRGYRKVAALVRPAMARLARVAAQGEADAARLREIGAAAPVVTGNIKFDMRLDPALLARGQAWRARFGGRPVWAAACTREGEEALLLDALARAALPADALLLLVPRHPQRFDEVAALLAARGLNAQRRSDWADDAPLPASVQVLLGDSLGELAAYYAAADLAFVGGSLVPLGSHSVIEPCAQGVPTLLGPSSFNFAEAVREAVELGAAKQLPDADAVLAEVGRLLEDETARAAMAAAGLAFVGRHRGAVERVLALLP
ncbi:lipid IV(A) 3-deoxy-D-manno-octulosonic acid transferase [Chitinimonas koreensis]|uniref:lipid IV(A) 3-deoxy-D-manno-octulosonic acid transferase n=1 Tax=Chitinimonas koreensis TaxID=356302 RepID=UPI00040923D0|nr:lipid IV(A) 3-deoxy-D-manno-octulosonic acid transferase [Chitinimonas koreensis]QNM96909.1 lipid IV(A) 3-deoxy-D-manno-octulosonic acid transferase [Chitinimonas koreensis]